MNRSSLRRTESPRQLDFFAFAPVVSAKPTPVIPDPVILPFPKPHPEPAIVERTMESKKVVRTDAEWRARLTPAQYAVARAQGTERPFCGTLLDNKIQGVYACVCCRLPLYASRAKFNSGTGWPSFFEPIADENITTHVDRSFGMVRVEILCARCDCHLGHVFPDGPRPTGQRHCVNSESLAFTDVDHLASLADPAAG